MSLGNGILTGLFLGIITGLFFGESCSVLDSVGNAFIALLQMSVLPYIVVSLLYSLGSLNYSDAKRLALKGGTILVFFWLLSLVFIIILPVCFPDWQASSFFSTSIVQNTAAEFDFLNLYIPANPFSSLANNVIPAVTLFCLCLGVSLIGIEDKNVLLKNLDILSRSLGRVTNTIVKFTPVGAFAIAANAAGTLTIEEFGRIPIFFITFIVGSLILAFIIIPLIVTMVTPFKYRDILNISKDAILTAVVTENLFIILPIIAANTKELLEKYRDFSNEDESQADVIIPIIYNFPNPGKLLCLLFIPFAGWYSGHNIDVSQYPAFLFSGLLSFFGSANVAIPFLLEQFHIPSDLFEIYLVAGIINAKFATMVAAVFIFCFTLITIASISGKLKFNTSRIVTNGMIIIVLSGCILVGTKYSLLKFIGDSNGSKIILESMKIQDPVEMVVYKKIPDNKILEKHHNMGRLEQIKKRAILRVGYHPSAIPFSFFNTRGDLIGYDVEMANMLARKLGCSLEFYPFKYGAIDEILNNDTVDIVMGNVSITHKRIQHMNFSTGYMELNLAFLALDHRKDEFINSKTVGKIQHLTLSVIKGSAYKDIILRQFPNVKFVEVLSPRDFFENKIKADAFLTSAEQGSVWTILYPEYMVIVPKPDLMKDVIAYPVKKGDMAFLTFLNSWLSLNQVNGIPDKLYSYWIRGENTRVKKRRWNILNDVMGIALKKHWENNI